MSRYFEDAAGRNQEDAVARVLESGADGGATVPSAPVISAVVGDEQVALTWSAPADGGSTITDYVVQYRETLGVLEKSTPIIQWGLTPDIGADLDTLNVTTWWYDWGNYATTGDDEVPPWQNGPGAGGNAPGFEYVPMCWGDWEVNYGWDRGNQHPDDAIGSANTLLGFNEPEITDQSNMTVARALALWPELEATGARLGSPAQTGGGTSWLASFMAGSGGYVPRVDFICAHWYPEYSGGHTFGEYMDILYAAYGLPIWVTEVCSLTGGYTANVALVPQIFSALATRPWVSRVAWFCNRDTAEGFYYPGTGLVQANGTTTTTGTAFAAYSGEITQSGPGAWMTFHDAVSATTGATVTDLVSGRSYDFRVAAVNAIGTGTWSNVPSATPVGGAPNSGSATVTYTETLTATGTKTPQATAATTYTEIVTTATGTRTAQGTLTTTHAWVTTAQGVAPIVGVKQGTADVGHAWSVTATGVMPSVALSTGSADVTYTESVTTATGTKLTKGTVTVPWTEATAPSVTSIDEDFNDGVVGQSINTTGYTTAFSVTGPLQFDGLGNIQTAGNGAFGLAHHMHATPLSDDCWTELTFSQTVASTSFEMRLALRALSTNINAGYTLLLSSGSWVLGRAGTQIASGTGALVVGVPVVFRLEAYAGTIRVLRDGVEQTAYTDPTPLYAGPLTGFGFYNTTKGDVLVQRHQAGLAFAAGAVGKRTPKADATPATHAWTSTAEGVMPVVGAKQGTAAVTYTASVTTSTGRKTTQGTATTTHTWTMLAQGVYPIVGVKQGTAAVNYAESVTTATGKRTPQATAATTYTEIVTTATGKRFQQGSAVVTYTETSTGATGKRVPKALVTVGHVWGLFAQGVYPIVGVKQGTAAVTYAETITTAVGKKLQRGIALVAHRWTVTVGRSSTTITDLDVTVGPIRSVDRFTIGPMRAPTTVSDFDLPTVTVGVLKLTEKYEFGPMTSDPPVVVGNFSAPTKVGDFGETTLVVHELQAESPVTVGV